MKIRNKQTGQIFEVVAGTLYPNFFEEVKDEEKDIKIGEPKVEYVIEQVEEKPVEAKTKKTTKKAKKGVKKNGNSKTKRDQLRQCI